MSNPFISSRLKTLQKNIKSHQAIFLTQPSYIYYFSGFEFLVPEEKEAYLLVSKDQAYLLHGTFNAAPHQAEIKNLAGLFPTQLLAHLDKIKNELKIKQLLVDKNYLYLSEADLLTELGFEISDLDLSWLEEIRTIKDQTEIKYLQKAGQIAAQAWEKLQPAIKVGSTEKELSLKLQQLMFELGSSKEAFPTIVAFGAHTALPHHQPTNDKLTPETAVLFDFGATYGGYRSDMTRSFWFGKKPDPEYLTILESVSQSYLAVLDKLKTWDRTKTTLTAQDLDNVARDFITANGYGQEFIHTTGHGIGLDVHEFPSLNWKNENHVKTNMVFTIEPGIYLHGKFGVRYENTLWIGKNIVELTMI